MKILVTGSAGFIGYHLVKNLIKRGDKVIGIDNINDYYDVKLKYSRLEDLGVEIKLINEVGYQKSKNFSFYVGDLENKSFVENIIEKEHPDAICNLAAQAGVRYSLINPQAYIDSNIVGFLNILEVCRKYNIKNLSYASSSSVYGLNKKLPFSTTDNVDHPVSLYAASKKSNELMAHTYSHLFGIQTTGLRFFTVYGPWGRPDMALFLFVKAALENKTIDVFNHGKMIRDFTYVDDIINGLLSVIDNPAKSNSNFNMHPSPNNSSAPYRIYNIGNNNPVKLMDFISAIESKLDVKIKKNLMEIQPGDVPETFADVKDLEVDFNYKPKTSVETGISNFIDWYKGYYGK